MRSTRDDVYPATVVLDSSWEGTLTEPPEQIYKDRRRAWPMAACELDCIAPTR